MKSQVHRLDLIYPPVTNQEAEWLRDNKEVKEQLKYSNLYFVAQKPETFFQLDEKLSEILEQKKIIKFKYISGNSLDEVSIDVIKLLEYHEISLDDLDKIEFELGEKLIRLWLINGDSKDILDWFTTEKLLFDRWREKEFILGFEHYRRFSSYILHYIGISKKDDSFKRLVIKPHDKRLRIVSNEHPLSKGARVTDEIILMFFRIDTLRINTYDFDEWDKMDFSGKPFDDYIEIIADAEKAFVKILRTEYNEVKFDNFPFSEDGLYSSDIDRYSYYINEDITLFTADNSIFGEYSGNGDISNNADFIYIGEEKVKLIKIKK
jgi:hypothetical protein